VGLGPTAVVRLEGALAHEDLRCCTGTSPGLVCLDENAVTVAVGRNRKPAPGATGMRKRPSTQAGTTVREQD
jgi:hypothetical protein